MSLRQTHHASVPDTSCEGEAMDVLEVFLLLFPANLLQLHRGSVRFRGSVRVRGSIRVRGRGKGSE